MIWLETGSGTGKIWTSNLNGDVRETSRAELERRQQLTRERDAIPIYVGKYSPGRSLRLEPLTIEERLRLIRAGKLKSQRMPWETEAWQRPSDPEPRPATVILCETLVGDGMMYPLIRPASRLDATVREAVAVVKRQIKERIDEALREAR